MIKRLGKLKNQVLVIKKENICPEVEKKSPLAIEASMLLELNIKNEGFPLVYNFNVSVCLKESLTIFPKKWSDVQEKKDGSWQE